MWISTSLPHPVLSTDFPNAPPRELWDTVLASLRSHRSQFVSTGFTGPLGVGSATQVSEKDIELYERIVDAADGLAIERAVQIYTSENLTDQLAQFANSSDAPLLLVHGGMDGGVPIEASAHRVKQLVPRAKVIVYEDGGHGESIPPCLRINFTNKPQSLGSVPPRAASPRYSGICRRRAELKWRSCGRRGDTVVPPWSAASEVMRTREAKKENTRQKTGECLDIRDQAVIA